MTSKKSPSQRKRQASRRVNPGTVTRNRRAAPATRRTRWTLMVLGLALLVAVGVAAATSSSKSDPGSTDPAAFDLPAIGDSATRIRLADFKGRPVVVNFFASWCTACDAELPGFAKVARELRGEVAFVGVNAQETGNPMFMPNRHGITDWPLARDVGGRNGSGLHEALGGRGMPITAFYDADGRLIHVDGGALPESALRQRLRDLYGIAA